MDLRTRRLMIMHNALYPSGVVDRLYVSRKEGSRELASNEDSVGASIQRLGDYIQKPGGRLITATRSNTDNTWTNKTTITRKQKWEEKQFVVRFKRLISNISRNKTWTWLRKGNRKRETESLLIAAQNNAIKTNRQENYSDTLTKRQESRWLYTRHYIRQTECVKKRSGMSIRQHWR